MRTYGYQLEGYNSFIGVKETIIPKDAVFKVETILTRLHDSINGLMAPCELSMQKKSS